MEDMKSERNYLHDDHETDQDENEENRESNKLNLLEDKNLDDKEDPANQENLDLDFDFDKFTSTEGLKGLDDFDLYAR